MEVGNKIDLIHRKLPKFFIILFKFYNLYGKFLFTWLQWNFSSHTHTLNILYKIHENLYVFWESVLFGRFGTYFNKISTDVFLNTSSQIHSNTYRPLFYFILLVVLHSSNFLLHSHIVELNTNKTGLCLCLVSCIRA